MDIVPLEDGNQAAHERLRALKNLSGEKFSAIVETHKLLDQLRYPNPYLPTMGTEIETFASRYPDKELPYSKIRTVEEAGIIPDFWDSFYNHEAYDDTEHFREDKWEAALQASPTYIILAREIQQLREKGILVINKDRLHYRDEYYPVHITLGGIRADFPYHFSETEPYSFRFRKKNEREWIASRWLRNERLTLDSDQYDKLLFSSDCFLLARLFDATGWVTSKNRLVIPSHTKDILKTGFMSKGTSGIKGRDRSKETGGVDCIEIREGEIWGEQGLIGFQKTIGSMPWIGASLKTYRGMPQHARDELLDYEYRRNRKAVSYIVQDRFESSGDATGGKLAEIWCRLRSDTRDLFASHRLPEPMHEYDDSDFAKLADHMPKGNKHNKVTRLNRMSRDIVVQYRSDIRKILGDAK